MRIIMMGLAAAIVGGSLQAQEAYVGVALDYATPHAGDDQGLASLLAGGTYDLGQMSIGAEVEYGASVALAGDYDTLRYRLMGGYDFDGFTALASFGGTRYNAGDASITGFNFGLGGQFAVSDALDMRVEMVRDIMDVVENHTTTTRFSAIYSF